MQSNTLLELDIRPVVGGILLFTKGVRKLLTECRDFAKLEEEVQKLSSKLSSQVFAWVLEEIDARLMEQRDRSTWEVVGFRERTVVTTFGEVTLKRRLYRNKETGKTSFLLDEALGLPPRARTTPRLKELAVNLATELSFAKAAEALGYLVPGVSPMTVWHALKEVGEELQRNAEELRRAVFEDGMVPEGKEKAEELNIEADGVLIRLQRSKKKHAEVKHVVAYEGKKESRPNRFTLQNKLVVSGIGEGEEILEEASAKMASKWDLSCTKMLSFGSDGASWAKKALEYFPRAVFVLDPYHLKKHLIEALAHDEEAFFKAREAISKGSWEDCQKAIEEAAKKAPGAQRKKLSKLLSYLEENWSGIVSHPAAKHLGTIEGQIQHNIARRMKHRGAAWTISGGDRMARVLAARANKDIENYISRWTIEAKKLKEAAKNRPKTSLGVEDVEAWLKARLPALRGRFAGAPWVKYVLRELSRERLFLLAG